MLGDFKIVSTDPSIERLEYIFEKIFGQMPDNISDEEKVELFREFLKEKKDSLKGKDFMDVD